MLMILMAGIDKDHKMKILKIQRNLYLMKNRKVISNYFGKFISTDVKIFEKLNSLII